MTCEGKKVALFVENMFEDLEFWYPRIRLEEAGAEVTVIGPERGDYTGKKGLPAKADLAIGETKAADHDLLVIPGGYAPDMMRRKPEMVAFVKSIHELGRPVAAICHAGWMLASAGVLPGRTVTSFIAIRDDLVNAGAIWVDEEVVVEGNLITSRTPQDLPAFCKAILGVLAESGEKG
jgi:protease I